MTQDVDRLNARVTALEADLEKQKSDAKEREIVQLKWGVRVLGLLAMAMGGWIWAQIGHIFDVGPAK